MRIANPKIKTFQEKEKLWAHLKIKGKMREKADPEIVRQALMISLESKAIFCINLITDLLYLADIFKGDSYQYRFNAPGTISEKKLVIDYSYPARRTLKTPGK
jgi:hypothetical protein